MPKAGSKATAEKAPRGEAITPATVKDVLKRRGAGQKWPQILEELGQGPSFVGRVRTLMKESNPSSVKKIGRGSPTYGTGAGTKAKANGTTKAPAAAKKATAKPAKTTAAKPAGPRRVVRKKVTASA